MNNTDKATARPWSIGKHSKVTGISEKGLLIFCTRYLSQKEDEANAELIVKAVNSHDILTEKVKYLEQTQGALVGACKDAFTMIGEGMIDNCLTEEELPEWQAVQDKLFRALNLAKGGE